MSGDLGVQGGEVHAEAVLDFWFALTPGAHFAVDPALDAEIARRFAPLRDGLLATRAKGWRGDSTRLLAAIIVLDQFSRNIFRDHAEAFAADPLALELSLSGIRRGFHTSLPKARAVFLLMPLMHCENMAIQHFSVECFEALGEEVNARFAQGHAETIARFGRFPARNAALGRPSRPEELAWLSSPAG